MSTLTQTRTTADVSPHESISTALSTYDGDIPISMLPGILANLRKNNHIRCVNRILITPRSWYTNPTGICKLFNDLDLSNVTSIADEHNKEFRVYRNVAEHQNMPRHTLIWTEKKGGDMIVTSRWETRHTHREPTNPRKMTVVRATGRPRGMHLQVMQRMDKLARGKGPEKEISDIFDVIKVKSGPAEMIWHLIRKTPRVTRHVKGPLTATEVQRKKFRQSIGIE
ncbi:hypothetical protein FZEAL_5397 [Fusarium zealandicum]|uniref:Uncharacterized protein n=1 Tax=Fusarium zealandicum TaxID=1053134 RepID=A0A8H4XKW5_9HYPO|nr:hypothetical protein FZEAL_5397 [Fusarium zealandicum]